MAERPRRAAVSIAVVSGAGRDPHGHSLGSAVCQELVARGYDVVAWDVRAERLAWTQAHRTRVSPLVVDVGDWSAVDDAVHRLGTIPDVLINCAAMTRHPWAYRAFQQVTAEQLEQELRVSLLGTCYPCLSAGRLMVARGRGAIVNVSSIIYPHAGVFQLAYAAAKAAVASLTSSLGAEFGRSGVRVNAVAPGLMDTDVFRALGDGGRRQLDRLFAGTTPIPAVDVARVIGFLASEDAAAVNGQVLPVDTGFDPFPALR